MTTTRTMHQGYDWIEASRRQGWHAVPSWGRDGWDLGSWPYVIVSVRDHNGRKQLCEYCEGDLDISTHETVTELHAAIDKMAAYHWAGEGWFDENDPKFRGPYISA